MGAMTVSGAFSSFLLLSVMCFSYFTSCSEILTREERDESALWDLLRSHGISPGPLAETPPTVCSPGGWCGFQSFIPNNPSRRHAYVWNCDCPDGYECKEFGIEDPSHGYFSFKCYQVAGSEDGATTEHIVDSSALQSIGGASSLDRMQRAEGMVDSATDVDPNEAISTTETGIDESSIWDLLLSHGISPGTLAVTPPTVCSPGGWCGFQGFVPTNQSRRYPYIWNCDCPDGYECKEFGIEDPSQGYFSFKCYQVAGSEDGATTEHIVDSSALQSVGGASSLDRMQRVEGMVDSATNVAPNEAISTTEADTASPEISSTTLKDRVGHFEL